MILSIGVDMVEVGRIRETMQRTPRFAQRVFTEQELRYCRSKGKAEWQSFAARFAAKEAFLKALKTGWRGKIGWHDVEVVVDDYGAPSFNITGEAQTLLAGLGVSRTHLSISHTDELAIANVVLETA